MPKIVSALLGCKQPDELPVSFRSRTTVRAAPLRSAAFSFENACSIGLRSGEETCRAGP